MWGCGIGDPILWGRSAFLLNFVPIWARSSASWCSCSSACSSIDSFWLALAPAGGYFVIHLIEGETVTPMLLARRFTLNPVLVIVGLMFWFWMWGVPGALLSVPMLAMAKIICDGVKPLNAIGHFIEGESP